MKAPTPEKLAHSIAEDRPQLAIDLLRACGYTKRAARRAIEAHLVGGGSGEAATPTCKRNTA